MKLIGTSVWLSIVWLIYSCGVPAGEDVNKQFSYSKVEALPLPVVFENGITTTNGICFTNDGSVLFTSKNIERTFDNGRAYAAIFESRFENGAWTQSTPVDLGLKIDAYHPVLSMDNLVMFFNSRSTGDTTTRAIPHNIWMTNKTQDGWGIPQLVEGVNTDLYESYPSVAGNGNLYFNSDRDGGKGGMDIYMSRYVDGKYQEPINLLAINSTHSENDLVVDPHENFIIFNRYFEETNGIDLFISMNKEGYWLQPESLDLINSDDQWELTPSLSPDGKYFFYELNGLIMQIDLIQLVGDDTQKK